MVALGIHGYGYWAWQEPSERNLSAELAARKNGVPFRDIWFTYLQPPARLLGDGSVNPHACGPYVDLTATGMQADDIRRMVPDIQSLYPRERAHRVAVFLSDEHFADTEFVTELRNALPRCEIFNRRNHPGFWR